MSIIDRFRRWTDSLRHRWMYRPTGSSARATAPAGGEGRKKLGTPTWEKTRSWARRIGIGCVLFLFLYYVGGALIIHSVDDDIAFRPPASDQVTDGSYAVAMTAALIEREVDTHRWTANDPFFVPSVLLDNMPNFQKGLMSALARFSIELQDQLSRTRGSSQVDPNLNKVSGLLNYPADIWYFNFSSSFLPVASAESQYRDARKELLIYNDRLSKGQAVFERRGDNLLATLDRIALDLGSSSAVLDQTISEPALLLDFSADDTFYNVKGQIYAYYMLLTALGQDFEAIIKERQLTPAWNQMLLSMREAALLQPWVVLNGSPDGQFVPSHLAAQGFYLLRARTQLREITNILLK